MEWNIIKVTWLIKKICRIFQSFSIWENIKIKWSKYIFTLLLNHNIMMHIDLYEAYQGLFTWHKIYTYSHSIKGFASAYQLGRAGWDIDWRDLIDLTPWTTNVIAAEKWTMKVTVYMLSRHSIINCTDCWQVSSDR